MGDRAVPFLDRIVRAPIPFDGRALEIARERWRDACRRLPASDREVFHADAVAALLDGVFGNSAFLTQIILREPAWLAQSLRATPEAAFGEIHAQLAGIAGAEPSAVMKGLRWARNRAAVLTALADLGGVFDLAETTGVLSRFADAALQTSLRHLLRVAEEKRQFRPGDPAQPELASGLIVLAMGKYGAFELNYSSDIDLIVFYDPEALPLSSSEPAAFAIRIVKDLVGLLQARTEDGYVFRVDLRLRPDGNASPVAISTASAELYYESAGQNWERAAMIKARPCAGDIAAGERFLDSLRPYVWRKNLDHGAIEDIHSIKRQIHAQKGHGDIKVAGHNLKLGRGGIREIEFFAQTQQLILGGRMPELQVRGTCEALERLAARNLIEAAARDELKESYQFLRTLEHRLQMVEDEQTHTLPKASAGLDHIARFSGVSDTAAFKQTVRGHLERVQRHYAHLFEGKEPLAAEAGSLVFTGVEEDPETVETLQRLGFKSAREISARIRGWHHGRIRGARSARARERLTSLVPILVDALSASEDPDGAFAEFARFVEALPTGVQIFSLLISNPWLLELLTEISSLAPRLARALSEQPAILDSLITAEFLKPTSVEPAPELELAAMLASAKELEEILDDTRIFAREHQFRIAVRVLKGGLEPEAAGRAFTDIAQSVIAALARVAEAETARRHGCVPGALWVILAMGKLGGHEMTASSDLDLVFVYDFDPARESSTGPHALHATQYFAKLMQRLISLLTVPTREGRLYDVDMRLRPSGHKGPIAVTLERLKTYHESQAWTYEHMAMTRARVIAGSAALAPRVEATISELIVAPRDLAKLSADALDMRARLETAKPAAGAWSLKLARGGLVDLEYLAQTLILALAHQHPTILSPTTATVFERIAAESLLPAADVADLIAATRLLQGLTQVLRIAYDRETSPAQAHPGLKARLAEIGGVPDFPALEEKLGTTQARVRELFDKYVAGLPAQFSN
jgi:glutamate-ammonia-ligase adenylyltransferase